MSEEWKDIPEYEGQYQASSKGRVRSIKRKVAHLKISGLRHVQEYTGRVLKQGVLKSEYKIVVLSSPGKCWSVYVHRLVLLAFNGTRPEGLECCHNDGVRHHNDLHNLRYDTRSANALDKRKHNTFLDYRGEKGPGAMRDFSRPKAKAKKGKLQRRCNRCGKEFTTTMIDGHIIFFFCPICRAKNAGSKIIE
jgi:hypothetical protein